MDHNQWSGIGRLVKAPKFYPAAQGKEHCTFTIVCNRVVPNSEGPQADYVPCALWGEEATKFVGLCDKGDTVGVVGRIRTSFVQKPNGTKDFYWEVRVDEVSYGMRSLKNLQPKTAPDAASRAVGKLSKEFSA